MTLHVRQLRDKIADEMVICVFVAVHELFLYLYLNNKSMYPPYKLPDINIYRQYDIQSLKDPSK